MKRDSRRNKEIGERERKGYWYRAHAFIPPLRVAELPPSSALCHSLERNDVRSGLFIVVKNTSKCPSSPARDKGQPPLLSVSLWFPWRCIGGTATSLVSTVFPPSIPWFPLSELCSDRRSEPHSPTLTLGNGASASLRRGKKYRKGAKVIEPFFSSSSSLRPIIFFVAKSTLHA